MKLSQTIPALPVKNVDQAAAFYRERLGFAVLHHDDGFAVVGRDDAVVHLWQASDERWRQRPSAERPVQSGGESFLAGTASCRIRVDEVDVLYAELRDAGVLHSVSREGVTDTDFGAREFNTVDHDGNLVTFFCWD